MKAKRFNTMDAIISKTSSPTFWAYWREMRRHEAALRRIYANDKHHVHVPEEVGSIGRVYPKQAHIITFWRCAVCMKDLTQKEADKLRKEKHGKRN